MGPSKTVEVFIDLKCFASRKTAMQKMILRSTGDKARISIASGRRRIHIIGPLGSLVCCSLSSEPVIADALSLPTSSVASRSAARAESRSVLLRLLKDIFSVFGLRRERLSSMAIWSWRMVSSMAGSLYVECCCRDPLLVPDSALARGQGRNRQAAISDVSQAAAI